MNQSSTSQDSSGPVLVEQVMIRKVIVVSKEASLNQATRLMGDHHIRHLAVVDEDRIPIGVFSDRDLFRFLASQLASGRTVGGGQAVSKLMTQFPMTVPPAMPLQEAARIMNEQKIGCVLVVHDNRRLMGILTRGNVLRYFAGLAGHPAPDDANPSPNEQSIADNGE